MHKASDGLDNLPRLGSERMFVVATQLNSDFFFESALPHDVKVFADFSLVVEKSSLSHFDTLCFAAKSFDILHGASFKGRYTCNQFVVNEVLVDLKQLLLI